MKLCYTHFFFKHKARFKSIVHKTYDLQDFPFSHILPQFYELVHNGQGTDHGLH